MLSDDCMLEANPASAGARLVSNKTVSAACILNGRVSGRIATTDDDLESCLLAANNFKNCGGADSGKLQSQGSALPLIDVLKAMPSFSDQEGANETVTDVFAL